MNAFRIGPHEVEIEEPYLVIMRWRGGLSAADVTAAFEYVGRHAVGWQHMLLYEDIAELGAIPAEVRRVVPGLTNALPLRGIAFVGGSFAHRTVVTLLLKVINLARKADNPSEFFADESAARSWLDARRAQLREEA